jgi:hypothetical protein
MTGALRFTQIEGVDPSGQPNVVTYSVSVEITRTSAQSANSPCSAMQMESLPSYPGSLPADDHEPVWRPDEHFGGGNAGTTRGDSSALSRIDNLTDLPGLCRHPSHVARSRSAFWPVPGGTVALVCLRCTTPFSFCAPRMRLAGRALWPKKKSAPSANVLLGGIGCNLSRK